MNSVLDGLGISTKDDTIKFVLTNNRCVCDFTGSRDPLFISFMSLCSAAVRRVTRYRFTDRSQSPPLLPPPHTIGWMKCWRNSPPSCDLGFPSFPGFFTVKWLRHMTELFSRRYSTPAPRSETPPAWTRRRNSLTKVSLSLWLHVSPRIMSKLFMFIISQHIELIWTHSHPGLKKNKKTWHFNPELSCVWRFCVSLPQYLSIGFECFLRLFISSCQTAASTHSYWSGWKTWRCRASRQRRPGIWKQHCNCSARRSRCCRGERRPSTTGRRRCGCRGTQQVPASDSVMNTSSTDATARCHMTPLQAVTWHRWGQRGRLMMHFDLGVPPLASSRTWTGSRTVHAEYTEYTGMYTNIKIIDTDL